MKGRSCKQNTKEGMEIDKVGNKLKEEPQLSGAYIRSLVKQLTSSRTKDAMNPKDNNLDSVDSDGFNVQNPTKYGDSLSETAQTSGQKNTQPPQEHKKQVRRRLHTSRPYQERLLNMAEARREIVTALKFHRASMKQANEQQNKQQQKQQQEQTQELQHQQLSSQASHLSSAPPFEQEPKTKSRRNPRIYPSNTNNLSCYNLDKFSGFSQYYPPPPFPPNPYAWPASSNPLQSAATDSLNFVLPNQTLGLNLNIHDFNNIDTSLYHNGNNQSIYSSSSASSSSPTVSVVTEEAPSSSSFALTHEVGPTAMADLTDSDAAGGGLHQAMDDKEMAEIRSLGEQHQMEWNDTMNLVTSAWWFKFLKSMEFNPEVKSDDNMIDGYQPFDQVMEFPAWLNANDSCLQQHFNDLCPDDYFQDPALPCMDIGEIEGMDGDWLA